MSFPSGGGGGGELDDLMGGVPNGTNFYSEDDAGGPYAKKPKQEASDSDSSSSSEDEENGNDFNVELEASPVKKEAQSGSGGGIRGLVDGPISYAPNNNVGGGGFKPGGGRPEPIRFQPGAKRVFKTSGNFPDEDPNRGRQAGGGGGYQQRGGPGGYQQRDHFSRENSNFHRNNYQDNRGGGGGRGGYNNRGGYHHQHQDTRQNYNPRGEEDSNQYGAPKQFQKYTPRPLVEMKEDEMTKDVPVDKERVALDSYTADLNIHVDSPQALSAKPVTEGASGWILGNVRCTHGIRVPIEAPPSHIKSSSNPQSSSRRIKCGFEVKIEQCLEFDREMIPRPEHRDAHFIRVGWSEVNCQGNLGEERDSIGLDSLGRVLAEGQCFRHEFSKTCSDLSEGDCIGAYIEYDPNDQQCHFSFRVNEKNLGVLAKIPAKTELSIFVPHILVRNIKFSVNFGTLGTYLKRYLSKRKKQQNSDGSPYSSGSSSEEEDEEEEEKAGSDKDLDDNNDEFKRTPSLLPFSKSYCRKIPAPPPVDPKENEALDFGDEDEAKDESKDGKKDKELKKYRYAPLIGDDFHLSRIVRCAGCVFRESPKSTEDCEVVMTMGLPGSGKTQWASKYMKTEEGKHKRYTVIGTEQILARMAILGKPRHFQAGSSYNRRKEPDPLQLPLSIIQSKWLELSITRPRNFILDQLNVFPGSHVKKMRRYVDFKTKRGFKRKAAVIMPDDDEYKKRKRKREKETKSEIPDRSVLELKNGITLPKTGDEYNGHSMFDDVIWADLAEEECSLLVEKYREEAKDYAPMEKKFKFNHDNKLKSYLSDERGRRGRDVVDRNYMNRLNSESSSGVNPVLPSLAPILNNAAAEQAKQAALSANQANPFAAVANMTPDQQAQWTQYYQQVYSQYYQQYAAFYGQAISGNPPPPQ